MDKKSNNNFFSIITVCYNSENTISKTFDSLLKQKFKDFEYIVIDGNSKDNTLNIIKEYEKKFKNYGINMRWISEPDSGIYDAMNKGIKLSNGKIIGILNSDDRYLEETLDIVYSIAKKFPSYDVYHGLCKFVSNNKVSMIRGTCSDRLNIQMIEHPSSFVRKESYNSIGLFDTKYKFVADYDFMLKMKNNNKKFYLIDKVLSEFNENGSGNSTASRKELIKLQKEYKLLSKTKLLYKYMKLIINDRK